jgi:hypothetical protein
MQNAAHSGHQQLYPPRPEDEPLHIDSLALSSMQRERLLKDGMCAVMDSFGPYDKVCHCYRCNYTWRATGLSAPPRCGKCGAANWNEYVVFCCCWCGYTFASATGEDAYLQYPVCPHCERSKWLPKLRPCTTWLDWSLSVAGAMAAAVGIPVWLRVLVYIVSPPASTAISDAPATTPSVSSMALASCFACLLPFLFVGVFFAPTVLVYTALVGKYSLHSWRTALAGGLCLAVPLVLSLLLHRA